MRILFVYLSCALCTCLGFFFCFTLSNETRVKVPVCHHILGRQWWFRFWPFRMRSWLQQTHNLLLVVAEVETDGFSAVCSALVPGRGHWFLYSSRKFALVPGSQMVLWTQASQNLVVKLHLCPASSSVGVAMLAGASFILLWSLGYKFSGKGCWIYFSARPQYSFTNSISLYLK